MKSFLLFISLTLVLSSTNVQNNQKIVETVNNLKTTWKAKQYDEKIYPKIFSFKKLEKDKYPEKISFKEANNALPESYDLRDVFSQCESVKEIKDSSECGFSSIISSVQTMSDRLCIKSNGELQTRVSAYYLQACCNDCQYLPSSCFTFWKNKGIPSGGPNGCKPYLLPLLSKEYKDPVCDDSCQDGYPIPLDEDKTYASSVYSVKGEENMMKEIYENGSVQGSFTVYEDFSNYQSGVYQHITGSSLGGHAIKIIGWGITEEGVKYWIVANSWGEAWGENGFFRILRGNNECGIESYVIGAIPKI